MPLKTLFLNPPSFENFDGGASSRWPATRDCASCWRAVWLSSTAARRDSPNRRAPPPPHATRDGPVTFMKRLEFLVLPSPPPSRPAHTDLPTRAQRPSSQPTSSPPS